MRKLKQVWLALGLIVLVCGLVATPAAPLSAQSSAGCYRMTGGDKWVCKSGGEMEFQSGSVLDVQTGATATFGAIQINGNAAVTGTLTSSGNLSTEAKFFSIPPATLTVTDGAIINVTGTIMELTSAGSVGAELAAPTDGQIAFIVNIGSQTIVITETANAVMAGNATLGAGDTLSLVASGVKWYQVGTSNN